LIFLSPLVGYTLSASLNNYIHLNYGQRGVAFISPICHITTYVVIAVHPPYPVVVIASMLAGFGNGTIDAAWNAWLGNLANANEVLGFLHGCYGLGATISPLIATAMITKGNFPWYSFYYVMVCPRQPFQKTKQYLANMLISSLADWRVICGTHNVRPFVLDSYRASIPRSQPKDG
jgi:MFS family permease